MLLEATGGTEVSRCYHVFNRFNCFKKGRRRDNLIAARPLSENEGFPAMMQRGFTCALQNAEKESGVKTKRLNLRTGRKERPQLTAREPHPLAYGPDDHGNTYEAGGGLLASLMRDVGLLMGSAIDICGDLGLNEILDGPVEALGR